MRPAITKAPLVPHLAERATDAAAQELTHRTRVSDRRNPAFDGGVIVNLAGAVGTHRIAHKLGRVPKRVIQCVPTASAGAYIVLAGADERYLTILVVGSAIETDLWVM